MLIMRMIYKIKKSRPLKKIHFCIPLKGDSGKAEKMTVKSIKKPAKCT